MKPSSLIILMALYLIIGCSQKTNIETHFSALQDTIVIKMQQNPGRGFSMKSRSINELHFKDSLEYSVIVPDDIENIQLASEIACYNISGYKHMKTKLENGAISEYYKNLIENNKIDTTNLLSKKENSICFLQGVLKGEEIFIVDENFNKDFRDDSVRVKKMIDFLSDDDIIKCEYKIFNGNENVVISNWIQVGKWKFGNNELYYSAKQNYTAEFFIEESNYKLEYFINEARFNFNQPSFSLITFDGIQKDTITDKDLLLTGDFLRLKEGDYRIYSLSNDGNYLTLLKDNSFEEIDGIQTGMLAPSFKCVSMEGDSIDFKNYKGKLLLITNVSSCYSPVSSYQCYKDLTEVYKDKIEILCLDKSSVFLSTNIKELELTGKFIDVNKNKSIEIYRPEFCSRTCFLINPEGRIIDKFEIFDWESTLNKYFALN